MKSRIYLIALLLMCSLITSCESDDVSYQNEFQNSKNALKDFKKETNNSYKYTVTFASWTGTAWETTLIVANGIVTQRLFKFTNKEGLPSNMSPAELEWTEIGSEIGSHKNYAAAVLTLDEIYAKAQQDWLLKRENAKTYFEAKNNGLLSTCGYVVTGCQDDCFIGIHIKSIELLAKE